MAALHVAMQHVPQQWAAYLEERMIYSKKLFKECCKNYIQLATLIQRSKLVSVIEKFSKGKYYEVPRLIGDYIAMSTNTN